MISIGLFVLISLAFLSSFGGRILSKLCSNAVVSNSRDKYALFVVANGLVACVFFFISGGFHIAINLPTALYSLLYSAIVIFSLVFNLIIYKLIDIASLTVILSALGLITTSSVGMMLFNEPPEYKNLLRIAIMLACVFLVFLDGKRHTSENSSSANKKFTAKTALTLLALLTLNCASTIVCKYFSTDVRVTDENSYFFFTNVFLVLGGIAVVISDLFLHPKDVKNALDVLRPSNLVSIAGNTVCSNIGSLVGLLLIAQMNVSVYTPISSAIGILAGFVASLCFREKVGAFSYIAALGAIVAVII